MPLAYKVGTQSQSSFNNNTVNVPLPSGLAIGDVLMLVIGANTSAESGITYPAAFTKITSRASGGNYAVIAYRVLTTEADLTTAVPCAVTGSSYRSYQLIGLNGVDIANLPAAIVSATESSISSNSLVFPSITTTSEKSASFYFGTSIGTSGTTWTDAAGTTRIIAGQRTYLASEEFVAAGSLGTRTVTKDNTTNSWPMLVVNLPVSGGRTSIVLGAATTNPTTRTGGLHVLDSQGAWVTERPIDRRVRPSTRFLNGVPVMSRCKHHQNLQTTDQVQSRVQHIALIDANDLRWVFANVWGVEQSGANTINVVAAVELPSSGGTSFGDGSGSQPGQTYRIYFNGQSNVDIPPGGYVISDPVPIRARVGQAYYTRTLVTCAAGGQIPTNILPTAGRYEFVEASSTTGGALTDKTLTGSISNQNGQVQAFRPQAIMGTPANLVETAYVVGIGDSIMAGANAGGNVSWLEKALERNRVPHFTVAMSGETGVQFAGNPGLTNGQTGQRFRGRLLAGATDIIGGYAVNDFNSDYTLNTVQLNTLRAAAMAVSRGARFHQTTCTPKTSSTDTWATEVNQTLSWNTTVEADRRAFNAWLRDGAPITSGTAPAATGSTATGVYRIGDPRHPINGVIDTEAAVAVTRASDGARIWSTSAYVNDGLHPGESGHNAMANVLLQYATTHFAPVPA